MKEITENRDNVQKEIFDFIESSDNYFTRTISELGDIMQYLLTDEIEIDSHRDESLKTLAECRFTFKFMLEVSQKWRKIAKTGVF